MARDLEASLPTVVDLRDGSFELLPDPRSVRQTKLALGSYAIFSTGLSAAFLVWAFTQPRIPWVFRVLPLAVSISIDLFGWYVLKAPVLKADAVEVSSVAPMMRRRRPRSDLAQIFRGQILVRGRYSTWVKTYVFVGRDGKIGIQAPGLGYSPEGVAEFARRLDVPLRGDFSEKVTGTVDLSKTG